VEPEPCRHTGPRAGPIITRIAGEHHSVDDEGELAGREQLRETDVDRIALVSEDVVIRHHPSGRKIAPGGSHSLDCAAWPHVMCEQSIARGPVLRRLPGKRHAHGYSFPGCVSDGQE